MRRRGNPDRLKALKESSRNWATSLFPGSTLFDVRKTSARETSAGVRACRMSAFMINLLGSCRFGDVIAVSAVLQFKRQFLSAAALNFSLRHYMDRIGNHMVEKPLVMGNYENTACRRSHCIDAVGDDAHSIDVEA